jgi:hypothetical protein
MRTASIFIPGSFEDAYLYMGRLIAVTENRSLRFYNLEQLVGAVERGFAAAIPVLTWLFVRNDWLASGQFASLMHNPDLFGVFFSLFDRLPQPCFCSDADAAIETEEDLEMDATVILDMRLYNQRVYIGADSGLFHRDYDWSGEAVEAVTGTEKRLDARCLSMSAGYGAVNASCGDAGLFTSFDDFARLRENSSPRLRRIADRSLRTAWLSYDLVNYQSYSDPLLLKSRQEEVDDALYHEKRALVGLGEEVMPLSDIYGELYSKFDIDAESIQFAYNSSRVLFVQTIQGHVYSIGVQTTREGWPKVTFARDYEYPGGRILGAQFSRCGTVIETENAVTLFSDGRWIELFRGGVLSVRAFAGSKRYQNVVCIVKEDGILLVGVVEENQIK